MDNVKQTIFMCFLQNNKKCGKNAAAKTILFEQDKNLSLVRIVIITFAKWSYYNESKIKPCWSQQ